MVSLNLTSEQCLRLQNLAGIQDSSEFRFLGFSLNLQTGEFTDDLQKGIADPEVSNPTMHQQITELLDRTPRATKRPLSGKQIKFREFPGGIAYENAFTRKVVDPIAKAFSGSEGFIDAALILGGRQLDFGQASVEIAAFNLVPITYILWLDDDFPASANVLFDESANNYLNAEGLANLAELTTWRLVLAQKVLQTP